MAEQKEIICPNCGARNEQYGKCEYCGADIVPSYSEAREAPIHGIHLANNGQEVLRQNYDKFKDETTTYFKYADEEGYIEIPCHYEWQGETRTTSKRLLILHKRSKYGKGYLTFREYAEDMYILADNKNYDCNTYGIKEEDLLYKVAAAQSLEVRFGDTYFADEEGARFIQLLARVFYSAFYDESQFKGAADELYRLIKNKTEKDEEKLREEKLKAEREVDRNLFKLVIIIILVLFLMQILLTGSL